MPEMKRQGGVWYTRKAKSEPWAIAASLHEALTRVYVALALPPDATTFRGAGRVSR